MLHSNRQYSTGYTLVMYTAAPSTRPDRLWPAVSGAAFRNIEAILERTCDDTTYKNNRENAALKSQVWGSLTLAQLSIVQVPVYIDPD